LPLILALNKNDLNHGKQQEVKDALTKELYLFSFYLCFFFFRHSIKKSRSNITGQISDNLSATLPSLKRSGFVKFFSQIPIVSLFFKPPPSSSSSADNVDNTLDYGIWASTEQFTFEKINKYGFILFLLSVIL
jgi:hypothetical protein